MPSRRRRPTHKVSWVLFFVSALPEGGNCSDKSTACKAWKFGCFVHWGWGWCKFHDGEGYHKRLVSKRFYVDTTQGQTPLMIAVERHISVDTIKMMFDLGAAQTCFKKNKVCLGFFCICFHFICFRTEKRHWWLLRSEALQLRRQCVLSSDLTFKTSTRYFFSPHEKFEKQFDWKLDRKICLDYCLRTNKIWTKCLECRIVESLSSPDWRSVSSLKLRYFTAPFLYRKERLAAKLDQIQIAGFDD